MRQETPASPAPRQRLEGSREDEVLDATLDVLAEVGYDKLTLDRVAGLARAGKATLYRRWSSKAELVADAMDRLDGGACPVPDTGSLRGDLLAMAAAHSGGALDTSRMPVVCGLMTAAYRDADLSRALRGRVVGPRRDRLVAVLERARARGEVAADVDLDLVGTLIPAMVLFWMSVEGRTEVDGLVRRLVDEVVLPCVRRSGTGTA